MSQITVTVEIPTKDQQDVYDTLCTGWGYNGQYQGTPESQEAYIKRIVANYIKQSYVQYKADFAANQAGQSAKATALAVDIKASE